MRLLDVQNNLFKVCKILMKCFPDRFEKALNIQSADEFKNLVLSMTKSFTYEELDGFYMDGIDDYAQKVGCSEEEACAQILSIGTDLLTTYGLENDEYLEWANKNNSIYVPALLGLSGEEISDEAIAQFKQVSFRRFSKEMISSKKTDLSARNGINYSAEPTENVLNQYRILDGYIRYSEEFFQYVDAANHIDSLIEESSDSFSDQVRELGNKTNSFGKAFPDTILTVCECFNESVNRIQTGITRYLRTHKVSVDKISAFRREFSESSEEAKIAMATMLSNLSEVYDALAHRDKSYSHEYFDHAVTMNHVQRVLQLPNAAESFSANALSTGNAMLTDAMKSVGHSFLDSVFNGIAQAEFESKFKAVFYSDQVFEGFEDLFDGIKELCIDGYFETLGISNYNLTNAELPEEEFDALLDDYFNVKPLEITDNEKKSLVISYFLDYPLDPETYNLAYLLYGDGGGQIKAVYDTIHPDDNNFIWSSKVFYPYDIVRKYFEGLPKESYEDMCKTLSEIKSFINTHVECHYLDDIVSALERKKLIAEVDESSTAVDVDIIKEFLDKLYKYKKTMYLAQPGSELYDKYQDYIDLVDIVQFGDVKSIHVEEDYILAFTLYKILLISKEAKKIEYVFELSDIYDFEPYEKLTFSLLDDGDESYAFLKVNGLKNSSFAQSRSSKDSLYLKNVSYNDLQSLKWVFLDYAEQDRERKGIKSIEELKEEEAKKQKLAAIEEGRSSFNQAIESKLNASDTNAIRARRIKETFDRAGIEGFSVFPSDDIIDKFLNNNDFLLDGEYPLVIYKNSPFFCLTNLRVVYAVKNDYASKNYSSLFGVSVEEEEQQLHIWWKDGKKLYGTCFTYNDFAVNKNEAIIPGRLKAISITLAEALQLEYNDGSDRKQLEEARETIKQIEHSGASDEEKYSQLKNVAIQLGLMNTDGTIGEYSFAKKNIYTLKFSLLPTMAITLVQAKFKDIIDRGKISSLDEANYVYEEVKRIYLAHDMLIETNGEYQLNDNYRITTANEYSDAWAVKKMWEKAIADKQKFETIAQIKGTFTGLFSKKKKNNDTTFSQVNSKTRTDSSESTNTGTVLHTPAKKPEIRFCNFCGGKNLRSAKFCAFCGKRLP